MVFSGTPTTPQLAQPVITLPCGTYNVDQSTTITHALRNFTIRYTTDGTTPTSSSPVYSAAVVIDRSLALKAFAQKPSYSDSNVEDEDSLLHSRKGAISCLHFLRKLVGKRST